MKVPEKYYDEVFDFKGEWDVLSKCGLKILSRDRETIVVVTELYQDNPGTSVTYAGYSLARQICESKGLRLADIRYVECSPDTNSKLSFYDEEYFEVLFPEAKGETGRPEYKKLSMEEMRALFPESNGK